jgi:hypothetical protein
LQNLKYARRTYQRSFPLADGGEQHAVRSTFFLSVTPPARDVLFNPRVNRGPPTCCLLLLRRFARLSRLLVTLSRFDQLTSLSAQLTLGRM